jgi:hypothetical protein
MKGADENHRPFSDDDVKSFLTFNYKKKEKEMKKKSERKRELQKGQKMNNERRRDGNHETIEFY